MSDTPDLYAEARALVDAGISLVPANADTKQPDFPLLPRDPETGKATWKPYQERLPTDEELLRWFKPQGRQHKATAIAVVCGNVSGGLVSIDFDVLRLYEPWCAAVGGLADGLPVQKTGGGRRQVFLRTPLPDGNQDLAWVEDAESDSGRSIGIETRGEHGYACVPPSLHPSGNRYEWLSGDLTDVPVLAPAHAEALLAAARKLDECPYTKQQRAALEAEARQKHERRAKRKDGDNDEDDVIGAFNERRSIESLLEAHGYKKSADGRYCRPERGVSSISVQHGRSVHFSTNDPLNDGAVGKGYGVHDAFDVYRILEHGSDWGKAVRAAAEAMGMARERADDNEDAPEEDDGRDLTGGGKKRPKVFVPKGAVPISGSAAKLGRLLAATKRYYLWGGAAVTLERDADGEVLLSHVKTAALPSAFESVAKPKTYIIRDNKPVEVDAVFSEQAAKLILHAEPFRRYLPTIRVLSRCPVLVECPGGGGQLEQVWGFDRQSGVYADGPRADSVPLGEAVTLLNEVLDGFDFATPSDRSRALAALITPALVFGRLLGAGGRAPVDLGEADQSQTGKGYRNKLTAAVYRTKIKTVNQQRGGVGSLEETFNTALVKGASFICLDNVRGKIDSPAIESFLTEDTYSARIPFHESTEIDPRRVVVQMTSNKADITVDLANRCSCVRLLKRADDRQFKRYPEGDVLEHVRAHQPRFLGAVFAVVGAWHKAGKPTNTDECRHDFRPWAQTLDWIVQNLLGAAPLLDGHREAQARMASPALNWLRDVALAVRRANDLGRELRAHELLDLLSDQGDVEIPGLPEGADVYEEPGRTKALQGLGRKLSSCFKGEDEVVIEGWVVRRQCAYDQALRRDAKTYRFDAVVATPEKATPTTPTDTVEMPVEEVETSAPMRGADEQPIGADDPSDAPNLFAEPPENGVCAYDCAYGAPMRDLRIGAACKAIRGGDLQATKNESAPNAPMGREYGESQRGDSPEILTLYVPIGALGAIGATGHPETHGQIGSELDRLTPEQREDWDERVAICTEAGGLDQGTAEAIAWAQIRGQSVDIPTVVGTGGKA